MSINLDKKALANRIKADLKKEVAGGDLAELSDYGLVADNGNIFAINEYFICQLKHNIFKPSEFEKEDYDEIVSLIRQRLQLQTQARATERARKVAKLEENPQLFYHSVCSRDKAGAYPSKGMRRYHQFWGRKNGQDYYVNVALNHPALDNVIFSDKFNNPKEGNYYLIEGVENLSSEPNLPQHWEVEGRFFKWVELENNITISLYNDNSEPRAKNIDKRKIVGLCNKCHADYRDAESWYYPLNEEKRGSWERLSWFCGKCWQREEKNWRQKTSQKNTIYKSEPQKVNLGDEHYYYFENGRWISLESGTPDPNTTNNNQDKENSQPLNHKNIAKIYEKEWESKKNKDLKEMSISIIAEFFRTWDIKSIEITSSKDLFIEYNNGSNEIISDDEQGTGIIKNCLERMLGKTKLDRQKLEKLQANSHKNTTSPNSPKSSYVPYLIGGALIIALLGVGGVIIYRLKNQKKNK